MEEPFIRPAIAAAIKRSRRDGRPIDRLRLRRETGLTGPAGVRRFEALVSIINRELDSAAALKAAVARGAEGRGSGGPSTTGAFPLGVPPRKGKREP
jgi:hypothetical protein